MGGWSSGRSSSVRISLRTAGPTILAVRGQKVDVAHWVSAGRTVAEIATMRTVVVPQLTKIGATDPTSTVASISAQAATPRTALPGRHRALGSQPCWGLLADLCWRCVFCYVWRLTGSDHHDNCQYRQQRDAGRDLEAAREADLKGVGVHLRRGSVRRGYTLVAQARGHRAPGDRPQHCQAN